MKRARAFFPLLTVIVSSCVALALGEVAVRAYLSWKARRVAALPHFDYADVVQPKLGPAGFLKPGFDHRVVDAQGGMVLFKTDVNGFRRERDATLGPRPGSLRILSVGDSFTAGYRVGQEQTFSRLLEDDLQRRGVAAEVLITQVGDPVTGLFYLQSFGESFHPQAVLLGITLSNDVAQTLLAVDALGPYELQDTPEGVRVTAKPSADRSALKDVEAAALLPEKCQPRPPTRPVKAPRRALRLLELLLGPPGEPIVSATPRRLLDSNGLGIVLKDPPKLIEDCYAQLGRVLAGYRDLCRARGIRLAVALFPIRYQVQPEDWRATVKAYGLDETCFDLELPNKRIAATCRELGIPLVDPTGAMAAEHKKTGRRLFFPLGDMHWNASGHRAFFEAAVRQLANGLESPTR